MPVTSAVDGVPGGIGRRAGGRLVGALAEGERDAAARDARGVVRAGERGGRRARRGIPPARGGRRRADRGHDRRSRLIDVEARALGVVVAGSRRSRRTSTACDPSRSTNESPAGSSGPTSTPLSVQARPVTPTRSPVATSTVTPGAPSLEAMLNQPEPPALSPVEIATNGSVVSTTRTMNVSVSPSPPESTTEQVTVVSPTGKVEPEVWLQVGDGSGSSSTSVALTEKVGGPAERRRGLDDHGHARDREDRRQVGRRDRERVEVAAAEVEGVAGVRRPQLERAARGRQEQRRRAVDRRQGSSGSPQTGPTTSVVFVASYSSNVTTPVPVRFASGEMMPVPGDEPTILIDHGAAERQGRVAEARGRAEVGRRRALARDRQPVGHDELARADGRREPDVIDARRNGRGPDAARSPDEREVDRAVSRSRRVRREHERARHGPDVGERRAAARSERERRRSGSGAVVGQFDSASFTHVYVPRNMTMSL